MTATSPRAGAATAEVTTDVPQRAGKAYMSCVVMVDHRAAVASTPCDAARIARLAPARTEELTGSNLAERLESFAVTAEVAQGPLVLMEGAFVGHDSPLVDVLADPRPGSAVLVGVEGASWPVRTVEGVVVSAASPFHDVEAATSAPDGGAGAALRVGADDLRRAAAAAREMAGVARAQGWDDAPVVALLLVAMVRCGMRVNAVPVHAFVAVVARDDGERRAARERMQRTDEHQLRLAAAAREADGFYSTFVVRRLSRPLTAVAVRWRLTPNQVTVISLGIAAVAAGAFAVGTRPWLIVGAVLLQVSLVVDCVDGELARYTRLHSALGAWLDAGTDRVKEFGVYAALAAGAARTGDPLWTLAATVLALQASRHFVDFGFAVRQSLRVALARTPARLPLAQRDDAQRDDGGAGPTDRSQAAGGTVGGLAGGTAGRVGRSATDLSERTNRVGPLVWVKRAVIMPIGERWLVISVAAAVAGPAWALGLLLALGVVAAAYTTVGRLLRSVADDVPLGRGGDDLLALADPGIITGWFPRDALTGRFGWLAPGVSRALEYGLVVVVTAVDAGQAMPLAYCYLFVLALWHYDAVYRLRHTNVCPPPLAQRAALGAPVRCAVLVAAAALAPGLLTAALVCLSVLVLTVTLVDSTRAWRGWLAAQASVFAVPRFTVVPTR